MQAFLKKDGWRPARTRRHATTPHTGGVTRRRGKALEAALLDPAGDELQLVGYQSLTMDAVADRAGTSRAVL
jgi:AcrR family transcriptional regulator